MINETELIKICRENDNIDFISKTDNPKIVKRITDKEITLSDVEISVLINSWINPIKNDDISNEVLQLCLLMGKCIKYGSICTPFEYIESKEWEQYKGNILHVYKHYDLNSFYYLCERIYYYYCEHKNASIETLLLESNNKYYYQTLCRLFGGKSQIQNEKNTGACTNLNMMMKYLVHDLKLWNKLDKSKLLIPLTYKVLESAKELLITNNICNTLANSIKVTEFFKDLLGNEFMKGYAGLTFLYNEKLKK